MAGEKKGKAYEALVHVALQQLIDEKKLKGPLHWNITPKAMSIEPDFMTGSDPDAPKTILLLNHSNAAGNSHMKFWRNLGELVEAKTVFPSMPRVYCLTFGVIKNDLEPIQEHAFDQFVWVREATHSWARDLDAFITGCVPTFPKGKENQIEFIKEQIASASTRSQNAFGDLKKLLKRMYATKSAALDKMWIDHRSRAIPGAPAARNTYVRRGLAKLRLLPKSHVPLLAQKTRADRFDGDDSLIQLGLIRPVVGDQIELADSEIKYAVRHLPNDSISAINNTPLPEGMSILKHQVLDIGNIEVYTDLMSIRASDLKDPWELYCLLKQQFIDPLLGRDDYSTPPRDVWVFRIIFEAIRYARGNKRQAYGYAKLVAEIKKAAIDTDCAKWLEDRFSYDPSPLAQQSEPVRRGLQDFLNRTREGAISDGQLGIVSWVLSRNLSKFSVDWDALGFALKDTWESNTLEARYLCHRDFEPIPTLITSCSTDGSFSSTTIQSAFSEAASVVKSGITTVLKKSSTLINWQSCSDSGRDHKKKELCGRAIGLRYHWNGAAFVRRPGVDKMILVLDGTWKQDDLKALLRAGWDEIYYPDEMDQLAKAIV